MGSSCLTKSLGGQLPVGTSSAHVGEKGDLSTVAERPNEWAKPRQDVEKKRGHPVFARLQALRRSRQVIGVSEISGQIALARQGESVPRLPEEEYGHEIAPGTCQATIKRGVLSARYKAQAALTALLRASSLSTPFIQRWPRLAD